MKPNRSPPILIIKFFYLIIETLTFGFTTPFKLDVGIIEVCSITFVILVLILVSQKYIGFYHFWLDDGTIVLFWYLSLWTR